MKIKEAICAAILKLKNDPNAVNKKFRIQRLQQMIDDSEKYDKINSANSNDSNDNSIEEDIEAFMFNRYNR